MPYQADVAELYAPTIVANHFRILRETEANPEVLRFRALRGPAVVIEIQVKSHAVPFVKFLDVFVIPVARELCRWVSIGRYHELDGAVGGFVVKADFIELREIHRQLDTELPAAINRPCFPYPALLCCANRAAALDFLPLRRGGHMPNRVCPACMDCHGRGQDRRDSR
ncbi:MAG: hypothetical protein K9N51_08035 [Candidatus Pacebacteria bacterium]|nr:hypothetical protein [Candidatus Paceibacterota bacterium]